MIDDNWYFGCMFTMWVLGAWSDALISKKFGARPQMYYGYPVGLIIGFVLVYLQIKY